jgi:threonine dehydrogenase-like Zn-dependent dehydrogenase
MVQKEINVIGTSCYERVDYEEVIEEIRSGRIQPKDLITDRIRLEDVPEKGFEEVWRNRDGHIKILVKP